jgi:transcriptional regulator with XRE-family HTH domain
MLDPLSTWLREQRLAHGWSVAEMGRQLHLAARQTGDHTVPRTAILASYVRRWEGGKIGLTERYRLHYCAALSLSPAQFDPQRSCSQVPANPVEGMHSSELAKTALHAASDAQQHELAPGRLGLRDGYGDADRGSSSAEPLPAAALADVLMAMIAEESLDFGEWADTSNIGDATLEHYTSRVRQLADDYQHEAPHPLLVETRRLRDRVFDKLRGHQRPAQTRELYLIAAQVCGLLAWMSADLSLYRAAEAHAWTGWVCADHADHDGARTWIRVTQSKIAYWDGRFVESVQFAEDGLRYQCSDSGQVMLVLFHARTLARMGRREDADAALGQARDAFERTDADLVGGLWSVSPARFHALAGSVQTWRQDPRQALVETSLALEQFHTATPRQHNYGAEVHARIDQAQAHLLMSDLDGAKATLQPVLALPPERRYEPITQHLGQLRQRLAEPSVSNAITAQQLHEEIETYCREAIFHELTP